MNRFCRSDQVNYVHHDVPVTHFSYRLRAGLPPADRRAPVSSTIRRAAGAIRARHHVGDRDAKGMPDRRPRSVVSRVSVTACAGRGAFYERRMRSRAALALGRLPAPGRTANPRRVIPGIEVLLSDWMNLIRGKRVGLLTNHSGRDRKGTSDRSARQGVRREAHGAPWSEPAFAHRQSRRENPLHVDSATGAKVYLCMATCRCPRRHARRHRRAAVRYQDVGARVYTYE
jgi:hypothetical protein